MKRLALVSAIALASWPQLRCRRNPQSTAPPCVLGQPVSIPAQDSTAPVRVTLDAHFPNAPLQSVSNTVGPVQAKIQGRPVITFMASAEDPDGIQDVEIWVEETSWSGGTQKGPGLGGAPSAAGSPLSPPYTCTQAMAKVDWDVSQKTGPSTTAYRLKVTARGINTRKATNPANATTSTSVLELTWP